MSDTPEVPIFGAMAKLEEYSDAMTAQYRQFVEKYAALKERAAAAEGQAKKDLETKVAEAKTRLDAVAIKLDDLQAAGVDRWEKVKEGLGNAFDDLKNIFK